MSKKASTDLFELIQNMNASEKRYFKLYAQRHFNNSCNGLKIFDYVDQLEVYDEEKLMKDFKKESFINKFSITKARLYDQILSSLNAFHAGKSINAQLFKQLHGIEILFSKALYEQCKKIIRSARKLAEKHERYEILVQINNWEKKLIENSGFQIEEKELQKFLKEELTTLKRISNFNQIWQFKSELLFKLNHKGVATSKEDKEIVQGILQKGFSILPESFMEKYMLNHLKSGCYFAMGELINCSDCLQKNYDLLMKNKKKVQEDPALFLSTSTNLIYVKTKLSDFEGAHYLLADLKRFKNLFDIDWTSDIDIKWFSSLKSIELNYRIEKGDIPGLQDLISSLDRDLENYKTKLSPLRLSYFLFEKAGIEIQLNQTSKAIKTLNELLTNPDLEQREDIYTYGRILEVVAQYDLERFELLPYTIRSLQRYLKSREKEFNFELDYLKHMSQALKQENQGDRAEVWSKIAQQAEQNPVDYANKANRYFDFVLWIKAKANGKLMSEVA